MVYLKQKKVGFESGTTNILAQQNAVFSTIKI